MNSTISKIASNTPPLSPIVAAKPQTDEIQSYKLPSPKGSASMKTKRQPPRASTKRSAQNTNGADDGYVDKPQPSSRKISHSAIERRRRERINAKLCYLKHLIPSCRHQDQLHKLSILQGAIEYILQLHDQLGIIVPDPPAAVLKIIRMGGEYPQGSSSQTTPRDEDEEDDDQDDHEEQEYMPVSKRPRIGEYQDMSTMQRTLRFDHHQQVPQPLAMSDAPSTYKSIQSQPSHPSHPSQSSHPVQEAYSSTHSSPLLSPSPAMSASSNYIPAPSPLFQAMPSPAMPTPTGRTPKLHMSMASLPPMSKLPPAAIETKRRMSVSTSMPPPRSPHLAPNASPDGLLLLSGAAMAVSEGGDAKTLTKTTRDHNEQKTQTTSTPIDSQDNRHSRRDSRVSVGDLLNSS